MDHLPEPLEITRKQAQELYKKGFVIYLHCNNNTPDTSLNTFVMRKDSKDARLNMYLGGRNPKDIPLDEYIRFLNNNQAEPVRYWTLYSTELFLLPLV